MHKRNLGARVGAIQKADKETVYFYGYGTYQGEDYPPVAPFGSDWDDSNPQLVELRKHFKNPKILLDNGKVVWGLQCWWGDEEEVKKQIGTRKIVIVDPEEELKKK